MVRKLEQPKFTGPLAEPIVVPFRVRAPNENGKIEISLDGLPDWMEKLELLREHYGIKREGAWAFSLAMSLAIDFVPGFKLVYDDPLAATLELPMKGGRKAGRSGKGAAPTLWGDRLIATIDMIKKYPQYTSDAKACGLVVDCFFSELKHTTDREARLKTIKRRLQEARKAQRKTKRV